MSSSRRKPRPLVRDEQGNRDTRLFIVACDDTYAPEQYFGFFRIPRIHVHVVPTVDGSSAAKHVLTRLLEIEASEDDERWLLLDTDHYILPDHFPGFISSISEARERGVHVALSKPCFELWLLLHHLGEEQVSELRNASSVEDQLGQILGSYNKTRLCENDYGLASVVEACRRACRLDQNCKGGDRPQSNTSQIYKLWKSIIANSARAQLPAEFLTLKDEGWSGAPDDR